MNVPEQIAKLISDLERAAYQKGWRDAISAVTETAGKMAAPGVAVAAPAAPQGAAPKARKKKSGPRETFPEAVSRAISEKPGMGAAAIVRWLIEDGFPANDGAVRTALRRLRDNERIEKHADGWYPGKAKQEAA